ncbi:MAG: methyltransferase domain-containing protein [Sphingobacteriaceae bacterium]|nr:methyltransferase domain-containing protein [Sphingobacteriaceae bacterium]
MKITPFFKFISKLIYEKIRGKFIPSQFAIKNGYRHRKDYNYDDDRTYTDEYQREVYELAKYYLEKHNYNKIVDIGCGSAYKLLKYFDGNDTVGIDVDPTYEYLIKKYPNRKWIHAFGIEPFPVACDIVICSDVIEHVLDPDELLKKIQKIDFKYLFLSTPERDMLYGIQNYGPPDNPAHVREWNYREFGVFVSRYFKVESHQITNVWQTTQLLICRPLD